VGGATGRERFGIVIRVTDWKAIAKARDLGIPAEDLERTVAPLPSLEETFRPLAQKLGPQDEPALTFDAAEDDQ
jgi:hypothetical protein